MTVAAMIFGIHKVNRGLCPPRHSTVAYTVSSVTVEINALMFSVVA
jgi:hypothetical protein